MNTKIAIIGLGYVGLPLALAFGKKYDVTGFDINSNRIDQLRLSNDVTNEVQRSEFFASSGTYFTNDPEEISAANVYIITVPTPITKANQPDLEPLISATNLVSKYLKIDDLVIYESTVYPGVTEEICVPILGAESGLIYNEDFFCGYSPERINPGDKLNTLEKIVKITSGSTEEAAKRVTKLYDTIIDAGTYQAKSIKIAEAAKVIENSQRDLNIAFFNELSLIFNKLNIDTMDVIDAASTKWNFMPFRPGLVGGHCISVDPYYLAYKAEQIGHKPEIILAGRRVNDEMAIHSAKEVIKRMVKLGCDPSQSRIGILGVTFKENCPDVRNSKIFDLINELSEWQTDLVIVDPWVDSSEVKIKTGLRMNTLEDLTDLDALVVAVGHTEFRNLTPAELMNMCKKKPSIIGDLKALYNKDALIEQGFEVFRL